MWLQCELMSLLERELIEILINTQVVRLGKRQLVALRQVKLVMVVALHFQFQCPRVPLMALPQSQLADVVAVVVMVVPEDQLVVVIVVVAEDELVVVLVRLAQDELMVVRVAAEVELVAVAESQPVVLAEVVVVRPQRQLRVLPVPKDQLVARHRCLSPRQETECLRERERERERAESINQMS